MAHTLASVCVLVDRVVRNLALFTFKEINWIPGMKPKLLSIMGSLDYVHRTLLNKLQFQPTTSKYFLDWLQDLKLVVIDIENWVDLILTLHLNLKVNNNGGLFQRFTRSLTKGDVDVVRELEITCRRFDEIINRFGEVEFEERCRSANPLTVVEPIAPPPPLRGVYFQIEDHLRPCFALCAVYSKGYPLSRNDMINMWMALGILEPRTVGIMCPRLQSIAKDVETIGGLYFEECLSNSFFQFLSFDGAKKVIRKEYGSLFDESHLWIEYVRKMNSAMRPMFVEIDDSVHDLATYMLEDDIVIVTSHIQAIPVEVMHILWNQADCSRFDRRFSQVRKTRLFAFNHAVKLVCKPFLEGLIASLKYLRVLNLNFSEFEELPESIGKLRHLRYLNLCWNSKLIGLPESICKLVNLQALELSGCIELDRLPKDIHKLVSLRYLSLSSKLKYFPKRLFRLGSSLRVLRLTFCSNLIFLPRDVGNLRNLRRLEIISCNTIESLPNEMKDLTSLERLGIICCERLDLEGWQGLEGLRGLWSLEIIELPQLTMIPQGLGGATSLQFLKILLCGRLRTLGEGLSGCTSLLNLSLGGCPSLTHLPAGIRKLESLVRMSIDDCPLIERRCTRDGPDWDLISHIRQIIVNGEFIQRVIKYSFSTW